MIRNMMAVKLQRRMWGRVWVLHTFKVGFLLLFHFYLALFDLNKWEELPDDEMPDLAEQQAKLRKAKREVGYG